MASSYLLHPLCTSRPLYPTEGRRQAAGRPILLFTCSREVGLCSNFSLLPMKLEGNAIGQANAVADANVGAVLVEVAEPSSAEAHAQEADFGPEFDHQAYAANTMIGYEPPPPPRIPFGGPYEDYYDEYVGVDYVPKQEKPTSSFLMFLESLNEKRAEEEAKLREKDPSRPPFDPKPNKHLFEGSKPLFTIPRPIQPAHIPRDYVPPALDPTEDATPRRIFSPMPPKKPKPQPQPQPQATGTTAVAGAGAGAEAEAEVENSVAAVAAAEILVVAAAENSVPDIAILPVDTQALPSDMSASTSQAVGVEEFSPTSTADVTPSVTSEGNTDNVRPLASDDSFSPSSSTNTSSPAQEPSFGGRTSSPLSTSIAYEADARPSYKPFETTSSTPLVSSRRPFEAPEDAVGSLFPAKSARPSSSESTVVTTGPASFADKMIEEKTPFDINKRDVEDLKQERQSSFQGGSVDKSTSSVSNGPMASPLGRHDDTVYGSVSSDFPQTSGSFLQDQPVAGSVSAGALASQSVPFSSNLDASRGMSPQADGRILDGSGGMFRTSEFYEPNDGHIVLGAVTYADEDELSLEIGGRLSALMTMRDFQPFTELGADSFFPLPSDNVSSQNDVGDAIPHGKVLLVEDKEANDGIYRGENVSVGTIVVAEVHSKALVEGRPVLTCRRLARSLAYVRIEQIMRTGEPIQLEITQYNEGGLQGYLEGVRAFLPRSELLRRPESSAALQEYVGKTMRVAILQAEEYSSNVILSEVRLWMSENLLLGMVHDLIIIKIHPYGLQVEVIGTRIRGFIHISNISRGFVTSLPIFFVEGEEIKAMVIKGRKPGQVSFSIEAIEPPSEEGLFLRDKETVYYGAEDVAKSTPEYQLPLEERRIFAVPSAATSVSLQSGVANLAWLELEKLRNPS